MNAHGSPEPGVGGADDGAFLRKGAKETSALDPAATDASVMYSPTTPPPGATIRTQGRNAEPAADPSNAANRLLRMISCEPGTV
jgi:hypothetical protein